MAKRKESRKQSEQARNGATLRAAVGWVIDTKSFADLPVHGNTGWQVIDLILRAVVWVWSGDTTLTGAFTEAHGWVHAGVGPSRRGYLSGFPQSLGHLDDDAVAPD